MKEPNYPALLRFLSADSCEYVVIATEGPACAHARPNYECVEAIEIEKTGQMPIDCALQVM